KSRDDDEDDEDSDDDSDDEDDDDEDDEDDDDEFADLSEAEIRAELKKATERLTKAGGSVKSKRASIRKLKRELEDARKPKPAGKSKGDDEAPDLDAIRDAAKAEAKAEADTRIKRSEAKATLVAAGVSREVAADLIGFVKLDDLDLDDDGEVEGLDDEIERIQKKYPTFFAKHAGRRRRESVAGGADRGGEGARPKKPLTASERQAALLTVGGSRYTTRIAPALPRPHPRTTLVP
ncbi:hypothetical protein ACKI16_45815, partial [Streptomyces scabiei]|uniref:phage scaffolding protein n=1 Tax=Streptomyces scabiei TaxID=1930 RepID=UPI0038F66EE9